MLATDMDMRSQDRPFEDGPEAFQAVHMHVATRPFLNVMVDRLVTVSEIGKRLVALQAVRADPRTLGDVPVDFGENVLGFPTRDDLGVDLAASLKDAKDHGLARAATILAPALLAADERLVGLDVARQRRLAVHQSHVLPDLVPHAERRGVGDAQLALQFLRRDAMSRRGEQVHGVKPLLQRHMRAVEGCSHHRVNVVATPSALIGRLLADAVVFPAFAALRAIKRVAVAHFHQVVKAGVVIREPLKKLENRGCLGHLFLHLIGTAYPICLHRSSL